MTEDRRDAPGRRAIRKSLRTNFNPTPRDHLNRVLLRARQAAHLPALIAGKNLDRPIFILGAPRSGTSLLYSVLRAAPNSAHWPGEAHEVWEADYHPALRNWESNVLTESDVHPAAAARIRRALLLVTGGRRRLIDKTPRNTLRVPFIRALFPDARIVYLRRDGRDNVNSLINAWRTPRYRTYRLPSPHSISGADPQWWKFVLYPGWREDTGGPLEVVCAKQWIICNEHMLEAARTHRGSGWIDVRYEDFVEDPVREIERIAAELELDCDEEVQKRARGVATTPVNVVTPPERGKWKRENPREIAAVEGLMRPVMEALGYETDAAP